MSDRTQQSTQKPSLAGKLNNVLSRYRTPIVIVAAALLVIVVGTVVVFQILDMRQTRSIEHAENVLRLFQDWQETVDSIESDLRQDQDAEGDDIRQKAIAKPEAAEVEESLRTAIQKAIDESGKSYGGLRAYYALGRLEWERQQFQAAIQAFETIPANFPESHLVGPALTATSAAYEAIGNDQEAIASLEQLVDSDRFVSSTLEHPRALFNLGRLYEAQGGTETAREYYNRLIDEHAGSSWTNLGRDRILWLNSRGATTD